MRTMMKRLPVVIVLAVALLAGSAIAASAATGFTVTAGGMISGTANLTGAAAGSSTAPAILFHDIATGANVTCAASKDNGTAVLGTGLPGANLIQLTGSSYGSCVFVGPAVPVGIGQLGTWHFNALSETGGVTTAVVSAVALKLTSAPCSFNLLGNADATYTNPSQTLKYVPGSHLLAVNSVIGSCFGMWHNGDPVVFQSLVPYAISSVPGPPFLII